MARRKATKATPKKRRTWKDKFLGALAVSPNVSAAATAAGHSRQHVYRVRQEDCEFAAAWDDAIEQAIDHLEGEMYRRAYKGVEKPVFGSLGGNQGSGEVGSVQEYSDTLAIFLAKAHRPEKYRDNYRIEHTGKDGGPIEHTEVKASLISKFAEITDEGAAPAIPGKPDGA